MEEPCKYRKNGYCTEDGHPCNEDEECRIYAAEEETDFLGDPSNLEINNKEESIAD